MCYSMHEEYVSCTARSVPSSNVVNDFNTNTLHKNRGSQATPVLRKIKYQSVLLQFSPLSMISEDNMVKDMRREPFTNLDNRFIFG